MVEIHVLARLLSLLAGGVALFAPKGSPLHRKGGIVFVGAMIVMTVSAFVVALAFRPNRVNVVAAMLTFYLVCTALLTVKRKAAEVRWLTAGLAVLALGAAARAFALWAGAIEGALRLARHLWRMTFALWIATTSFFLGQAKVFPDPLRKTYLLAIPVLIVLVMLFYWLLRVLIKKNRAVQFRGSPS